ncbi:hypothetical protein [Aestuariivirga sp.]|jgi:hypothetical protein|uniref:hypothetical protein n=1 Tax=Aestuariivirga sp. TaxID=2650926 RepID=UPI0037846064
MTLQPVIIGNRPLLARLLLLFWAAAVVMGALFALAGLRLLGPGEKGGAAVLLLLGMTLSLAGIIMSGLCWRIARLRGPAIELTATGLLDHRFSPGLIPWEALTWKIVFNGRGYSVQFDVEPASRTTLSIYWPQRALGLFNSLLGQPRFTLVALGTGHSAHGLGDMLAGFKPAAV